MTDVAHPQLLALVERKHQWDAAWTSMATYLSGKVSRRFDSARTLTLAVPNPNGKATDDWKVGDQVRVSLGWNRKEALPVFEGVVPPGRGLHVAGPPPTLRVSAVDAIGLLVNEQIAIAPTVARKRYDTGGRPWWDMETLSGGLMKDMGAYGQDGTITGTTSVTGRFGAARSFVIASDRVSRAALSWPTTSAISILSWVRLHSFTIRSATIFSDASQADPAGFVFLYINSGVAAPADVVWQFTVAGPTFSLVTWTGVIPDTNFHHVVVRADYGLKVAECLVDRVSQGTRSMSAALNSTVPLNGRTVHAGSYNGAVLPLDGDLDELHVVPAWVNDALIAAALNDYYYSDSTYAGWEGGMAIRDVLLTAKAAPLLGDLSAMKGSNPIRWIGKHISEKTGVMTRKAYIDAVLAGMTDDETNADAPRPYHYWMTARADGTPAVYLQKQRDPAVDPPIRTISHLTDLLGAGVELRSDQATSALAYASSDVTKWVRYEDDEAAARYGRLEAPLSVASTNTDDLQAEARRAVQVRRYPVRSHTVTVRDALRHELNQVVALVNPRYGGSGNFLLVGIDFDFSPGGVQAQLRLASAEELITDALR